MSPQFTALNWERKKEREREKKEKKERKKERKKEKQWGNIGGQFCLYNQVIHWGQLLEDNFVAGKG